MQTNADKSKFFHARAYPRRMFLIHFDCLLSRGWFRMYLSVFTTTHIIDWDSHSLFKVYWLRYNLEKLSERKSHAIIRKRNSAFRVDISSFCLPRRAEEVLYRKYFLSCGLDTHDCISDAMSYGSNRDSFFHTMAVRVWDRDKLVAMGIFDIGGLFGCLPFAFLRPRLQESIPRQVPYAAHSRLVETE
jgi:hypothetical protein